MQNEKKIEKLAHAYFHAKDFVIQRGFEHEIDWQENVSIDKISETDFIRETSWVILSSGMHENVIRKVFPNVSSAFYNWESASRIAYNESVCYNEALKYFKNRKKIEAIIYCVKYLDFTGYEFFIQQVKDHGIDFISKFPFLGPVTSYHLAKNIGYNVVKPDRHLERIAKNMGFLNPNEMCASLSNLIEEKISVIDLVLWRYANQNRHYLSVFN